MRQIRETRREQGARRRERREIDAALLAEIRARQEYHEARRATFTANLRGPMMSVRG